MGGREEGDKSNNSPAQNSMANTAPVMPVTAGGETGAGKPRLGEGVALVRYQSVCMVLCMCYAVSGTDLG
eukprot:277998-Rhodomonas_salina.3